MTVGTRISQRTRLVYVCAVQSKEDRDTKKNMFSSNALRIKIWV